MTIDQYEGLADLSSLFLDRIQSDLALLALKHFEEIYDWSSIRAKCLHIFTQNY